MDYILIALFIFAGCLVLLLFRNEWVLRQRIAMLNKCIPGSGFYDEQRAKYYDNLLTYNQMLLRFWVWDIERLRANS